MGHPGTPGQQHAHGGIPQFFSPLAVAFFTLLFVPLTAGGRSMADLSNGGELLFPLLQVALVALLFVAVFRPRSGGVPVAIAAVSAAWLVVFVFDGRFSGVRVAIVALMAATLVLATIHAVRQRQTG